MKTVYEYIWLDHSNGFRSKTKVVNKEMGVSDIVPGLWNYDGSSTEQANGSDSEVYVKPVSIYPDPFRKNLLEKTYLVLCDTWLPSGEAHPDNNRPDALKIFENEKVVEEDTLFGIEQEFFFYDIKNHLPLGLYHKTNENKVCGFSGPQGPYYCGVGAGKIFGRKVAEKSLEHAMFCGLNITGLNFEVAPGQCEMQLCEKGIKAADDLLMLRYLLVRTAEDFNIGIDFHPKPVKGDWNGSGCHTNYSTKSMREKNGLDVIMKAIEKLEEKHHEHISVYGKDNDQRLTGKHETASMEKFSYGVADRGSSIRIPRFTNRDKRGYLEDRRPASNMDPYLVLSKIAKTTILD
tara:strand:+ start:717 stop:1760 length:1044 start_codon:yes stop_codon:yes gene_type:complete